MRYQLPDGNVIVAAQDFIDHHYPDAVLLLEPVPVAELAQATKVCSPAQGLVALYAIKGLTESDIAAVIASIPDPVQRYTASIGFNRATEWRRNSDTMQAITGLLGLSEEDIDALFAYAATVRV